MGDLIVMDLKILEVFNMVVIDDHAFSIAAIAYVQRLAEDFKPAQLIIHFIGGGVVTLTPDQALSFAHKIKEGVANAQRIAAQQAAQQLNLIPPGNARRH